jgi:integrase
VTSQRRATGTGGLSKRADGLWIGSVTLPTTDGRQRRKTVSSRDRNEAIRKLRDLHQDVAKGKVTYAPSMTVGDWLDYWLEKIVRPNVRPRTYTSYEQAVRLYIKPHIGGVRLDRLTPAHVRDMVAAVQKVSTRNGQKAHQTLRRGLQAAIGDGVVDRNVAAVVSRPAHIGSDIDPFEPDQVRHILRTSLQHDIYPTRWLAAFLTGLRQGELLGMEWDRVDLDAETMNVQWQLQLLQKVHGCGDPVDGVYRCLKVRPGWCPQARWDHPAGFKVRECHRSLCWTAPKSVARERFDVPLIPAMAAALRVLREQDTGPNPHGLVWHHTDGRPLSPREDNDLWAMLLKVSGIPHVKQHAARHTTISLLQARGVDEPTRMAITGHSSVAAHSGYVHVSARQAADAAGVLTDLVFAGKV